MALALDISVCQTGDCKYIIFKELTGAYNASSNPTGYGAPNKTVANAKAATLAITLTDGTIVTLNLYSTFPTSTCTDSYTLSSFSLALSAANALASIPDGLYKFVYTVTFSDETTATVTKKVLFSCQVKCGKNSLFAALPLCDCDCKDNEEFENAMYAQTMYNQLLYAAGCNSSTAKINKILTNLSDFLAIVNSTCGCLDKTTTTNVGTV